MEIKEIKSKMVFFTSLESSLQTLTSDVGEVPNKLAADLEKLGIKSTGPQEWIYRGSDGDPAKKFILDICIPVNKSIKDNPAFKNLETKKCAVETHKGSWADLGLTYKKMMDEITASGQLPGDVSREVYIHCDFVNQENNITEIQIELS